MHHASHRTVRTARRSGFALALVLALPGCVAQTLPGAVGDPQAPPGQPAELPAAGSGEGVLVEYFAFCRGCTVSFSTPDGMDAENDVDGAFRRRVTFSATAASGAVSMTVTPSAGARVQRARILLDAEIAASVESQPAGEAVTLTAMIR